MTGHLAWYIARGSGIVASYPLFALATVHALSSGTDTAAAIGGTLSISLGAIAVALALVGLDRRWAAQPRRGTIPSGVRR